MAAAASIAMPSPARSSAIAACLASSRCARALAWNESLQNEIHQRDEVAWPEADADAAPPRRGRRRARARGAPCARARRAPLARVRRVQAQRGERAELALVGRERAPRAARRSTRPRSPGPRPLAPRDRVAARALEDRGDVVERRARERLGDAAAARAGDDRDEQAAERERGPDRRRRTARASRPRAATSASPRAAGRPRADAPEQRRAAQRRRGGRAHARASAGRQMSAREQRRAAAAAAPLHHVVPARVHHDERARRHAQAHRSAARSGARAAPRALRARRRRARR